MSSIRTIPLLARSCKLCRTTQLRAFHGSACSLAKSLSRPSPRVTAASRQTPLSGGVRMNEKHDIETALPPLILLNAAQKSGALSVQPLLALEFLRKYQTRAKNPTSGWVQELGQEYGVTPFHMAIISGVLAKCPETPQKILAKMLMLSASELGENSATFELISSAIRTGTVMAPENTAALQRLGVLAKNDNDPKAMLLMAKILYGQQGNRAALEWLQKSTRPPTGSLEWDGAGDALIEEGRILMDLNDTQGARQAFEKAALKLDDPAGYFYLSKMEKPGSSEQEIYLLKASSAGIVEAWHNLGALQLEKSRNNDRKPASMKDYGMAGEWFQLAAAENFGPSIINLAMMNKAVGKLEEAWKWMAKAEKNEEVKAAAKDLQSQWTEQNGIP